MRVQMYTKIQMAQKFLKKKRLFSSWSKIARPFCLFLHWNSIILLKSVNLIRLAKNNYPSQEN
jgi:hypothetical protein